MSGKERIVNQNWWITSATASGGPVTDTGERSDLPKKP